jgi:hypothetical protein
MNALILGLREGAARLIAPPGLALPVLGAAALTAGVAAVGPHHARAAADRGLIFAGFGLVFPVLAFLTAELTLGGRRLDRAARVVARHGVSGRSSGLGMCLALAGACVASALLVAASALFAAYPLSDARLWSELVLVIPIATLAGLSYAGWYTLASSFGTRGGGRKWLLGLDWVLGASASWFSLLFPRGHVRNLLGGTPVMEMSQGWAFGVLVVGTGLATALGLLRSAD